MSAKEHELIARDVKKKGLLIDLVEAKYILNKSDATFSTSRLKHYTIGEGKGKMFAIEAFNYHKGKALAYLANELETQSFVQYMFETSGLSAKDFAAGAGGLECHIYAHPMKRDMVEGLAFAYRYYRSEYNKYMDGKIDLRKNQQRNAFCISKEKARELYMEKRATMLPFLDHEFSETLIAYTGGK